MKALFTLTLLVGLYGVAQAQLDSLADSTAIDPQDTVWTHGGNFSLAVSQVGLTNWAAGGESSVSANTELNVFLNMDKPSQSWENELQLGLGYIREGGGEATFKKNNDLLLFTSRYGQKLNQTLTVTGVVDFRTQLAPGYRYTFVDSLDQEVSEQTSGFMAPGYLVTSLGVAYTKKDLIKVNFAPVTGKFTFVMDEALSNQGAYGVMPGDMFRGEFGYSLGVNFKKKFSDNINFRTNILFFSDYEELETVDVNWEAFLRFRINKFLTSSISTQMIWDEDIDILREDGTMGPAPQLRTVLNIGLGFDFWQKE